MGSVAVVDVLLGWTLVGRAVSLAMACRTVPRPAGVLTVHRNRTD
jgi:hypothetical protein